MRTPTTVETAQKSFLTGPKPSRGGSWVSDLSFEQTRLLVGKSFAGTKVVPGEPTFTQLLESVEFKSHQDRKDLITFLMSFFLQESLDRQGKVFAKQFDDGDHHENVDEKKNDYAGVIVVREHDPSQKESWFFKLKRKIREFCLVAGMIITGKLPSYVTDKGNKKVLKVMEKTGLGLAEVENREHHLLGPQHKHWYVAIVACDPDHQGKGQGSELMRRLVDLADEVKMDCFLSCSGEKNRTFYSKFGYEVVGETEIRNFLDADKPLIIYLMTRHHK